MTMLEGGARRWPEEVGAVGRLLEELQALLAGGLRPADAARGREASAWVGEATGSAGRLAAGASFLGSALGGVVLAREWTREELEPALEALAAAGLCSTETAAGAVYLRAAHEPRLLALPRQAALEAQLRLLTVLAPAAEASVWVPARPPGRLQLLGHVGPPRPSRSARAAARRALAGERDGPRSLVHGLPVAWAQEVRGALVVRTTPAEATRVLALAQTACGVLGLVLEREALLRRGATDQEELLLEAGERRVREIGFDLHDGPLQKLAWLRGELDLFGRQLRELGLASGMRDLLVGRAQDLAARLEGLDEELRGLASSIRGPGLSRRSLEDVIAAELADLAESAGIRARHEVEGDVATLDQTHRIALFRIVQEALGNVREHSGATEVSVSVRVRRGYVRAEIVDNGVGFDVERTLARAESQRRLGLLGMTERAMLLGGTLWIESRPGGPTRISVVLPGTRRRERRPAVGADGG